MLHLGVLAAMAIIGGGAVGAERWRDADSDRQYGNEHKSLVDGGIGVEDAYSAMRLYDEGFLADIKQILIGRLESDFGDSVQFACIFGSVARREWTCTSDVDLMIVRSPDSVTSTSDDPIAGFQRWFIAFQKHLGFTPDYVFPCEVVSADSVERAIRGAGFNMSGGIVHVDPIGPNEWNAWNEHRQWLAAVAGPNEYVIGNQQLFSHLQHRAIETILLICLVSLPRRLYTAEECIEALVGYGKEYLGFVRSPYTLDFLNHRVGPALLQLANRDTLQEKWPRRFRVSDDRVLRILDMVRCHE